MSSKNITFLFLLLIAACHSPKKVEVNELFITEQTLPDSIAFLLFKINKNTVDSKSFVQLVNEVHSVGKMKQASSQIITADNYLTLYFYNNKTLLDSIFLDHPLYKHLEYVEENGTPAAKDIELTEAEFFFRWQMQTNLNKIRIFETLKNKNRVELNPITF